MKAVEETYCYYEALGNYDADVNNIKGSVIMYRAIQEEIVPYLDKGLGFLKTSSLCCVVTFIQITGNDKLGSSSK